MRPPSKHAIILLEKASQAELFMADCSHKGVLCLGFASGNDSFNHTLSFSNLPDE